MRHIKKSDLDFEEQVRSNIAFENYVFAVLSGAGIGGALSFGVAIFAAIERGGISLSVLVAALLGALLASFVIFLIGFFSGVAIVMPVYRRLETAENRKVAPFYALALVIAMIVSALMSTLPGVENPGFSGMVITVVAALLAAHIFVRSMRAVWLAKDRQDAAKARQGGDVRQLH